MYLFIANVIFQVSGFLSEGLVWRVWAVGRMVQVSGC